MLRVSELAFDYEDKLLIQGVSFVLSPGAALHVKGENGVGKTTLLKLLAGLLTPHAGEVAYRGEIAYVGHKEGVNTHLTPREHLQFDLNLKHQSDIKHLIKQLALEDVEDTPMALLSAGQKRRTGLLRLCVSDAKLWLLDEPLVGLDTKGMQILGNLMQEHLKREGMIVFTSHQTLPFELPVTQELFL